MRPRGLDEIVGQEALVGSDGFLRRAIADDRLPSVVLWGPPGCGKTTLARILAEETRAHFVPFSAVTSGIKEVKQVMADAARLRRAQGRRTLVFVDEIHRFNKAQQDAFLPYVESGDIVLIGATTENPSFELNAALLSRCRVLVLEPLSLETLRSIQERALEDPERGFGGHGVTLSPEALGAIAQLASGDARKALNLLELVAADAVNRGSCRGRGRRIVRRSPSRRCCSTTSPGRSTTTSSRRSTSRCARAMPTPPSTGSRACSQRARTRTTSPVASCVSPARTWVWRRRRP